MNKLQTIIEYALEQGWDHREPDYYAEGWVGYYDEAFSSGGFAIERERQEVFIYTHDFLKAVFGLESWQHYAQQMIISEDPVSYIYDWIEEQEKKGKP